MLIITGSTVEAKASGQLRAIKPRSMRARYHRSDLNGAVISAARAAMKAGQSFYVYSGNAYGSFMWRVTYDRPEALCLINNSGRRLYEVRPDREIIRHSIAD